MTTRSKCAQSTASSSQTAGSASIPRVARAAVSGAASSSPAGTAAQVASAIFRLESPLAVLLDDLAVALDAAAVPQLLDHVPVHGAAVRAADERQPGAEGEVDRAVHLLVEERVLHEPLDAGIAA